MNIVITEGTPLVPCRARDSVTDKADFLLAISIGCHYPPVRETAVKVQRHGRTDSEEHFLGPQIARYGIRRIASLPRVYLYYFGIIRRALKMHPETRDACYIGRFWFPCLVGIWARKRGLVKKVVYWGSDFYSVSGTWENRLVSGLFLVLEKYCVRRVDEVWYVSERTRAAHEDPSGTRWTRSIEKLVPIAFDVRPEVHGLWQPSDPHRLVYVGMVYMGQGVEIILAAMKKVRDRIPDIKLDVVGTGPDLENFRNLAVELGVADIATFHGYVEEESRVHQIVGRSAAGFALYADRAANHTWYAVTAKAFMYVGCGVPVFITESAGSFDYMMKGGAGLKVEYQVDSVAEGIMTLCASSEMHERYRESARRLADRFCEQADTLRNAMLAACGEKEG